MNAQQRKNDPVFQKLEAELRAAGIPFTSPDAVFRRVKQIRSGRAYLVAAQYFGYWSQQEQFPELCMSLRHKSNLCASRYRQISAEGV